jgi:hypothetical protein
MDGKGRALDHIWILNSLAFWYRKWGLLYSEGFWQKNNIKNSVMMPAGKRRS